MTGRRAQELVRDAEARAPLRGARVLVVEDEPHLAAGIAANLEAEGCKVAVVGDGVAALSTMVRGTHDLVVLDVMLPELDGFTVCEQARAAGVATPVLFLTARGEARDRIRGLRSGGDDYLTKPFHLEELLLRVGAILRRSRNAGYDTNGVAVTVVEFEGNRVDLASYRGTNAQGEPQELTHKEAMILKLLAERAGEVVSRDDILDRVWGYEQFPSSRTIDNFILRLRRRFERDPEAPRHFHTVRGVGYRFTRDPEG